uniref:G_PROTEIN_RECEP_F1_2 domain-containing protein n=1 Tax=Caenorhabditis japonica TaxID=281687 RepID=A0A8R1HN62_CAEJA
MAMSHQLCQFLRKNESIDFTTLLNHSSKEEATSNINKITYAYIAPFIIIFGIVGDVLTVVTLTHPLLRKTSIIYTYLALLAMTDLANALMGSSVWVVVFLTLSQYMAVCKPFAYGLRRDSIQRGVQPDTLIEKLTVIKESESVTSETGDRV